MVVGTSTIVPTTPTNLSGAKSLVWDIKDKLTFDPDGPGGLQDLDGDSFFDDMRPGDSTLISFNYTVDCDLACGADLEYDIKGTSKYTDYCRVLNSSRSTSIYQFGFEQTAPISQTTPLPNYGTMSGSSKETRVGDFTFNYTLDNVDTSNAIMKLRINYSNTMQVIEPINFLGTSLTLADFTVIGAGSTDTTNGNYNPVTDVDSALEYTLTKAQIALVFDNTLDSLSYAMTHISCDSFQNQGNSDGWELLFQTTNTPCAINSMAPCVLDLACNKGFTYNVSEGCGSKPCYNVSDSIYRTSPYGFTNEDGTTSVIPTAAGTSKFYEGDTLTFLRTAMLNADWPIMEPTSSLAISRGYIVIFLFLLTRILM